MERSIKKRALVVLALFGPASAALVAEAPKRYLEVLSPVYTVDGIYKSMTGPQSTREWRVLEGRAPELVWVTGYKAEMVGPDGAAPLSQEFMCHSNLDIDMPAHRARMGWIKNASNRLFTLSQGQQKIQFPDGFGMPIYTDELMWLTTQVLNLNPQPFPVDVRHRVTLEFVFDRDLEQPMHPLFLVGVNGLVLLEGDSPDFGMEHAAMDDVDPNRGGAPSQVSGCMIGANAGTHSYQDPLGKLFTGHWVVPPGRQVLHTLVNGFMNLPFDTTVHYIAVHLHPFAETLELHDLTTDSVVFVSHAENATDRIGLARVESYSSVEGIQLFKGHDYEVISTYENPTNEPQDSMASMFLYVLDRELSLSTRTPRIDSPEATPEPSASR